MDDRNLLCMKIYATIPAFMFMRNKIIKKDEKPNKLKVLTAGFVSGSIDNTTQNNLIEDMDGDGNTYQFNSYLEFFQIIDTCLSVLLVSILTYFILSRLARKRLFRNYKIILQIL